MYTSLAGGGIMFLGIESPHKRVLKAYCKGGKASADSGLGRVRLLRDYGIGAVAGFVLGEVSENKEEVRETIEYAREMNQATAQFSILTPYLGTEMWLELKDRLIVHGRDVFDGLHTVYHGDHLRAQDMESLLRKAYLKFYLRPGRVAKQIGSAIRNNGHHPSGPHLKTVRHIFRLIKDIYPKDREVIC